MFGQALGGSREGIAAEMTPAVTRAEARFMRRRVVHWRRRGCSLRRWGGEVSAATISFYLKQMRWHPHPVYGAKTELGRRVVWAVL